MLVRLRGFHSATDVATRRTGRAVWAGGDGDGGAAASSSCAAPAGPGRGSATRAGVPRATRRCSGSAPAWEHREGDGGFARRRHAPPLRAGLRPRARHACVCRQTPAQTPHAAAAHEAPRRASTRAFKPHSQTLSHNCVPTDGKQPPCTLTLEWHLRRLPVPLQSMNPTPQPFPSTNSK